MSSTRNKYGFADIDLDDLDLDDIDISGANSPARDAQALQALMDMDLDNIDLSSRSHSASPERAQESTKQWEYGQFSENTQVPQEADVGIYSEQQANAFPEVAEEKTTNSAEKERDLMEPLGGFVTDDANLWVEQGAVEPTEYVYYDENGFEHRGYYDEAGNWIESSGMEADSSSGYGYYDEAGNWVEYNGYYDEAGNWVDLNLAPVSQEPNIAVNNSSFEKQQEFAEEALIETQLNGQVVYNEGHQESLQQVEYYSSHYQQFQVSEEHQNVITESTYLQESLAENQMSSASMEASDKTYNYDQQHILEDSQKMEDIDLGYNEPTVASSFNRVENLEELGFPAPHAVMCFGFGGKFLVTFPHRRKLLSSGARNRHTEEPLRPGPICIKDLSKLTDRNDEVKLIKSFPGPLSPGLTIKSELESFIRNMIEDVNIQTGVMNPISVRLLWKFLLTVLSQKKVSPVLDISQFDSPTQLSLELAQILSGKDDGSQEDDIMDKSHGGKAILKSAFRQSADRTTNLEQDLMELQSLFIEGKQEDALKYAIEHYLWDHALFISFSLGLASFQNTASRFASCELEESSPLHTLYMMRSGNPSSMFQVHDLSSDISKYSRHRKYSFSEVPLVRNWQGNLAIILSNPSSHQRAAILQLGDTLWRQYRQYEAAHFCYLVADEPPLLGRNSRYILIGSDHYLNLRSFAHTSAIHRTEVYEYMKSRLSSGNTLHVFQPIKLYYAGILADLGLVEQAVEYVQIISDTVRGVDKKSLKQYYSHVFLSQLDLLEKRLRLLGKAPRKAAATASKVIGNLFSAVSDFFVGAEPESEALNDDLVRYGSLPPSSESVPAKETTKSQTLPKPADIEGASKSPLISAESKVPDDAKFVETKEHSEQQSASMPASDNRSNEENKEDTSAHKQTESGFTSVLFGLFKKKAVPQADLQDDSKIRYDPVSKRWIIEGSAQKEDQQSKTKSKPPPAFRPVQSGVSDSNEDVSSSKPPGPPMAGRNYFSAAQRNVTLNSSSSLSLPCSF